MAPPQNPRTYWAAEDDEKLASSLRARIDVTSLHPNLSAHLRQVGVAYWHYYGAPLSWAGASTSELSRSGKQQEELQLRVNYSRALVNAVVQLVTAPKLGLTAVAANTDFQSQASAMTGTTLLEWLFKEKGLQAKAVSCVDSGIPFGESFLFLPWDETEGEPYAALGGRLVKTGDVKPLQVESWQVIRDAAAPSYEACAWWVVRVPDNRYAAAARWPQFAPEILNTQPELVTDVATNQLDQSDDMVFVDYFFHTRTAALPQGREAILVGKKVMRAGPLSYKTVPLARFSAGERKGTPFPYTSYWDVLGIQEYSDSINSDLATNISTLGSPILSAEKDADLPLDQLGASGPRVLYRKPGSQPPVTLQFQLATPEHFKHLDRMRGDQRQLMGLNDVALGQSPSAQMNAQAFAVLQSAAITANSGLQTAYTEFVRQVGKICLEIYEARCPVKRKIAITGQDSRGLTEFEGKDLAAVDSVTVEIGNALQQSPAGRMQIAQMRLDWTQKGGDPEEFDQLIETGRADPKRKASQAQWLLIKSENEELGKGINPLVSSMDDAPAHIQEHASVMASLEARKNPAVVQAVTAHIQEHQQVWQSTDPLLLQLCGIKPPPPPAPPPPGAPGAPPAGPGGPPDAGAPPPGAPPPPEGPPSQAEALMGVPAPPPPEVRLPSNPATGLQWTPTTGGLPT